MSIVFAILIFSFLIFIHELGHFIAAKLSGVQVNEFAMFMGPAIFKWGKGETVYSIRCIPIGGYCAMEGEDEDTDNPRSFQKAAWWKRLIILSAGSFMNLIAGFLLLLIVFTPMDAVNTPVIAYAEPDSAVFDEQEFRVGDRILELDGEKIYVAADWDMILSLNPGDAHDIVVERDGQKVELKDLYLERRVFPGETQERLGFTFSREPLDFWGKLSYTGKQTLNVVRTVRLSLQMLLTGEAGIQDLSGPVGIVQIMSETAEAADTTKDAILNLLYFGGFIAINLAVMNMLPIPALDGGRVLGLVLTTTIEKVTRKKINPKIEGYIHGAGMILLLVLMALILFKDVFTIFKG